MFKYNEQNIFVGYIKSLLKDFNLPTPLIYTTAKPAFQNELYLYKGYIVKCNETTIKQADGSYLVTSNTFTNMFKFDEKISTYVYGDNQKNFNLTTHLHVNNLIYDEYTHNYLGNYLRYQRDYNHINLMSLYNCFTNNLVKNLKIPSFKLNTSSNIQIKEFNSDDMNYKIYEVPIKCYQKYTITLECDVPVEMICCFYGKNQVTIPASSDLYIKSYKRVARMSFDKPILYDNIFKLDDNFIESNILSRKDDLKLFIKIPTSKNTAIVVLEGDYRYYNDNLLNDKANVVGGYLVHNKSINNYEYKKYNTKLISPLQLLYINSGVSHPFADRLIEYLVGNCITNQDSISDNIKRTQKALQERYETVDANNYHYKAGLPIIKYYGIWDDSYKNIIYDVCLQTNLINTKTDLLGYVDKDVETKLGNDIDIYGGNS